MLEAAIEKETLTNDTPPEDSHVMSPNEFKAALPRQVQGRVTVDVMRSINSVLADQKIRDSFRDNLLGYTNVLNQGRFKLSNYIDAVKYVSFKLMGYNNLNAYAKTFPNRYNDLVAQGLDDDAIANYVHAYNRNKIVNAIWEQTLIPSWVLNADKFQQAINVQADLMLSAKSEKVRAEAANSLLSHLKPPETKKVELDIGFKDSKSIEELREITLKLAATQKGLIEDGITSAQSVAETPLTINHEEVEDLPLDKNGKPVELDFECLEETKKSIFESFD